MALSDASRKFVVIDVGAYGRQSDANIFENTTFWHALKSNSLNIPAPRPFPGTDDTQNLVFCGDEAFALRTDFLRPFSRRDLNHDRSVFNYRLSRARRVVECAFGRLAALWKVFDRPLRCSVHTVDSIVKACCVLHNMTIDKEKSFLDDNPPLLNMPRIAGTRVRNTARNAQEVRDEFMQYFVSDVGALPWQDNLVQRTS